MNAAESNYATLAHTVLREIAELEQVHGHDEALRQLIDHYQGHGHEHEGRLARLLLHARQQARLQDQLNHDRQALHAGRLGHEERASLGHHYETIRYAACEYNHTVRGFIESNREHVSRDELTGWLTTASRGRHGWAEGEVTGAISEIALHAALMGMPELSGVRYATLDEDLHGFDFMATWQGRPVTIDAKTGHYPPITNHHHGQLHLEISVPREALDGFRLTRGGLDGVRHDVRKGLHEHGGVDHHGAHAPYRPKPQPA